MIRTRAEFTDYQLHVEFATPTGGQRQQPGARQQRRVPERQVRDSGARQLSEPDLRRRLGVGDVRTVSAAGERLAAAGRMAVLRHRLHVAAIRGGRQAGHAGDRHRPAQRHRRAQRDAVLGTDGSTRRSTPTRRTTRRGRSRCRITATRCGIATSGSGRSRKTAGEKNADCGSADCGDQMNINRRRFLAAAGVPAFALGSIKTGAVGAAEVDRPHRPPQRRRHRAHAGAVRRAAHPSARREGDDSRLLLARRHRRGTGRSVRAPARQGARDLHADRHARQPHGGARAGRRIEPRPRPGGQPLLPGRRRLRADAQQPDADAAGAGQGHVHGRRSPARPGSNEGRARRLARVGDRGRDAGAAETRRALRRGRAGEDRRDRQA